MKMKTSRKESKKDWIVLPALKNPSPDIKPTKKLQLLCPKPSKLGRTVTR